MWSNILAGSVVALSIGKIYAAGYAWSGVNMGGFDFGCSTDVCASVITIWMSNANQIARAIAIFRVSFLHYTNIRVMMALVKCSIS